MTPQIKNIIVVADLHHGSRLGLCPPGPIPLDDGGTYTFSPLQEKIWNWWDIFWNEWVPLFTRKEAFAVVINGDSLDGVPYQSKTPISTNINDQKRIAKIVLEPIVQLCEGRFYMIRGTEAHVGKSGEQEEELAESLNAIPNESGQYARWDMWMNLRGALIHFSHHVGTTQSSAYESTAVYKELVEAYNEAGRWNNRPPDVVCRSHRHRQFECRIASEGGYAISFTTPAWQLQTPFTWRLASGRASTPQIGGYLIRCGDEDGVYTRFKVFKMPRSQEVIL